MISPQLISKIFVRLMAEFPAKPTIDTRNGYQITSSTATIEVDENGVFLLRMLHTCENQYGSCYNAGEEIYTANYLPSWRLLKYIAGATFVMELWEQPIGVEIDGRYYTFTR